MSRLPRSIGLGVAAAFLAAATLGPASVPAQAQIVPKHVAVVVDFGSQGGVTAHCSPSGGSGYDVLKDDYSVRFGKTGLVTWIGDVGNDSPPLDLYWSYWHFDGHWAYASTGPLTYTPKPGSIDGWVYGDGKTPPPSASYASICAGQDPTVAPSTHRPAPKPAPTHSATHRSTHTSTPAMPPDSTSPQPQHSSAPESRPGRTHARHPSAHPSPTPATSASSTTSIVLANSLPTAAPKSASQTKQSGVPPWGTALAIGLVVALGGAAFWRSRVHHQRSP